MDTENRAYYLTGMYGVEKEGRLSRADLKNKSSVINQRWLSLRLVRRV
jgi:hypothetical protein